ncbi:DNA ligase-like domain-containing protein [Streptomyces goshikiensis]|uniref:hypothetical protein n=1 Tax=Streptomyces goshikiensis TaxID=1942 RepID=UPI0037F2F4A7
MDRRRISRRSALREDGQELLHLPCTDRRARLESLFTEHGLTAPWTLCPVTTGLATAGEWPESCTDVPGLAGVVAKLMGRAVSSGPPRLDQDHR